MHDPPGRPYEIGENLFDEPSIRERSEQALVSRALAQRLEFRALLAAGASLDARRSSSRAGRWPRLDAFGNAYYANPNARVIPPRDEWRASWDVGVQLTWSPNDVLITDSVESEIEAQQEELNVQRRMLEDTIRQEVHDARERLIRARAAAQASERGLAAAEEAYALRRLLFEVGRATSADLLDVETELLRARLEVVSAAIERRAAAADLAYAVGTDVRH
jgi:outer membrane protein TolC